MMSSSNGELTNGRHRAAIEVENLRVIRGGFKALDDVSLRIAHGTITGLLGPSGCGKTTLMRCVVGTQIVESGTVRVLGLEAGSPALRRSIGYVTQNPTIYNDLRSIDNVRYFAALYGRTKADADAALDAVGLRTHRLAYCGDLSGGQRGRVSLACALVTQPELLVLDEPTVGLDPVMRAELWEQFQRLAAAGATLLVSSHVMDEADHCGDLVLMREGRVLVHTTPSQLRRDTACEGLEEAFLSVIRRSEVPAA
ncbi:ABC transporter ATP-binding protein [Mycobacterium sp. CBMA271]|uniref:ABC transporter ATP-binding protein n=1 Tax=unclassified Mycobacteroides TaxID=2618759 RepID=UPI0012DE95CB|nr:MULTISPECIES: ABC transporter ATP-binding protein [unclassified Mycobacteroides]MUM17728.1 multidrug ABC transporter ATP-binding protein [Mycobacteroides sp. CBMA 326]MUM22997.1 ABC transporter ATP-binding protein [Mycobacteroides sp. CBMA 271]